LSTFTVHFNPKPSDESASGSYVPYITQKTIELTSTTFKAHQSVFTLHGHTYHLGPATLNPEASGTPTNVPTLQNSAGRTATLPKSLWMAVGTVVLGAIALL
jgi:hypothetical protein